MPFTLKERSLSPLHLGKCLYIQCLYDNPNPNPNPNPNNEKRKNDPPQKDEKIKKDVLQKNEKRKNVDDIHTHAPMVKKLKLPTSSPLGGKPSEPIGLLELCPAGVNLDPSTTPANPIVGPEASQTGNSLRQTCPPGVVLDPRQCTPNQKPQTKNDSQEGQCLELTCPPKLKALKVAALDPGPQPNLKPKAKKASQEGQCSVLTCPPKLKTLKVVALDPGPKPSLIPKAKKASQEGQCLELTCPPKLKTLKGVALDPGPKPSLIPKAKKASQEGQCSVLTCPPKLKTLKVVALDPGPKPSLIPKAKEASQEGQCLELTCPPKLKTLKGVALDPGPKPSLIPKAKKTSQEGQCSVLTCPPKLSPEGVHRATILPHPTTAEPKLMLSPASPGDEEVAISQSVKRLSSRRMKLTLKKITIGDCNWGVNLPQSYPHPGESTHTGKRLPPGEWEIGNSCPSSAGKMAEREGDKHDTTVIDSVPDVRVEHQPCCSKSLLKPAKGVPLCGPTYVEPKLNSSGVVNTTGGIRPLPRPPLTKVGKITKCGVPSCVLCPILLTENTVTSKLSRRKHYVHGDFTCHTERLVYLLQCARCNKQYIGQTVKPFVERAHRHLQELRAGGSTKLQWHFNADGHTPKDVRFKPLSTLIGADLTRSQAEDRLKVMETMWIQRLGTMQPVGLNYVLVDEQKRVTDC